ncbi:class I SAM-dependent methyltransferase [Nonomuraea terrae]|uniref:class I SAM-dependent methyltransferase n=1 Tax=Nonomuraea terrae TaxID=2530383 RepID=UPI0037A05C20
MPLSADAELEQSPVVANRMNRERRLRGYDDELGLDLLGVLRAVTTRPVRRLDLCCGAAYALGEAAGLPGDEAEIVGVDLVDFFACPPDPPRLRLFTASVPVWRPDAPFDLITCVHGLHYVGDTRTRRVRCNGRRTLDLPCRYLGADDRAGPDYTGRPAVDSSYALS